MLGNDYFIKGEPYQYNLGWLIEELMSFKQDLATAIDLKTIKYADPIQWDITTQYPANTVVVDPKSGTAYMSKVPVPAGVELTNVNYWVVVFNYQDIYNKIMDGVAFNDRDQDYATKDLLVNDLVWYAGDLYRVTRAIPTGSKYIPGTNLVKTTIESLLARYYGRDRTAQVSNDTVNVSGDYTLVAGDIAETSTNRTIKVTKDREIDVDGSDSVHVDGASTLNVGGPRTEVYAGDKTEGVTGTYTGKFGSASFETGAPSWLVKFPNKTVDLANIHVQNYIDVTDYGAKGDGNTNDTDAFIAALNASKNSLLFIPSGTYLVKNLPIIDNMVIIGNSAETTTLKLLNDASANDSIFKTPNYDDLINTNSTAGNYGFHIRELSLEGNVTKAGKGLQIYGHSFYLYNMFIHDFADGGVESEWSDYAGQPPEGEYMESFFDKLRVYNCKKFGMRIRGPHDSHMTDCLIYNCYNYGLVVETSYGKYAATGLRLNKFHAYSNGGSGIYCTATITGDCVASESNNSPYETNKGGYGIELHAGAEWCQLTNCDFSNNKFAAGMYLDHATNSQFTGLWILNKYAFKIGETVTGNGNTIKGIVYNDPAINAKSFDGYVSFSDNDIYAVRVIGNEAANIFRGPLADLYNVEIPTSTGKEHGVPNYSFHTLIFYMQGAQGVHITNNNVDTNLYDCQTVVVPPLATLWFDTSLPTAWSVFPLYITN